MSKQKTATMYLVTRLNAEGEILDDPYSTDDCQEAYKHGEFLQEETNNEVEMYGYDPDRVEVWHITKRERFVYPKTARRVWQEIEEDE